VIFLSVERKVFLIDWDKFLDYAKDCRGQGMYYTNETTMVIRAMAGVLGTEICFENEKDYQKALKQLEDLEFIRVYDVKIASIWLTR
jgi:hypothetical protein